MPRIRLILEYDGTAFEGWQLQPGRRTVQGVVEQAVMRLLGTGERILVESAGRTDSGVHARGQVGVFESPASLPLTAWTRGLSALLPDDVAVVDADEVPAGFDPRRHASGKRYVYRIWNGPHRSPLRARQSWWLARPLDVDAMREAARPLLGEHDFTSFRAQGCTAKTPVRRITRLELVGRAGDELTLTFEGTAFLRYMVRNVVGTLVHVGRGRLAAADVPRILAARDRDAAGPTAPPQGLTLDRVFYEPRR